MIYFRTIGAHCAWPRRQYNASELPAEYHADVLLRMKRAALRDMRAEAAAPNVGRERIRSSAQRAGIEERAEEAASECYVQWLSLRGVDWCAAGDHARAVSGSIRYMRLSAWRGRTGAYRAAKRALTAERLAMAARLRERNVPTPAQIAEWGERLPVGGGSGGVKAQRRRAQRIAEGLGLSADGLARLANGLAIEAGEARPRLVRVDDAPALVRCPVGAHCPTPWLTAGACDINRSTSTH